MVGWICLVPNRYQNTKRHIGGASPEKTFQAQDGKSKVVSENKVWRFMDSAGAKNPQLTGTKCFIPRFPINLVVQLNFLFCSSGSGPLSTWKSQGFTCYKSFSGVRPFTLHPRVDLGITVFYLLRVLVGGHTPHPAPLQTHPSTLLTLLSPLVLSFPPETFC